MSSLYSYDRSTSGSLMNRLMDSTVAGRWADSPETRESAANAQTAATDASRTPPSKEVKGHRRRRRRDRHRRHGRRRSRSHSPRRGPSVKPRPVSRCSRVARFDESSDDVAWTTAQRPVAYPKIYPGVCCGHHHCIQYPVTTPKTMGWLWSLRETGGVKVKVSRRRVIEWMALRCIF